MNEMYLEFCMWNSNSNLNKKKHFQILLALFFLHRHTHTLSFGLFLSQWDWFEQLQSDGRLNQIDKIPNEWIGHKSSFLFPRTHHTNSFFSHIAPLYDTLALKMHNVFVFIMPCATHYKTRIRHFFFNITITQRIHNEISSGFFPFYLINRNNWISVLNLIVLTFYYFYHYLPPYWLCYNFDRTIATAEFFFDCRF